MTQAFNIVEKLLDSTYRGITPKEFMAKMGLYTHRNGGTFFADNKENNDMWSLIDMPGSGGLPRLYEIEGDQYVIWNVRMRHHNVGMFTINVCINKDGTIELDLEDDSRFSMIQGPYNEEDMAKVNSFKQALYKYCGAVAPYDPFDL